MKRLLLAAALLASALSSSRGQSLSTLPRATVPTGLNDSTLVYVSDSAKRSRAAVAPDFRALLSLRAFDSLVTSNLRLTSGVKGSATWLNLQTFASGQRVDSATGAARASGLVGSPAITVSSCTGCAPAVVDSATGAARAQILTTPRTIGGTSFNGSANIVPGLSDSSTGSTRAQTLTTPRALWGQSFNGSTAITGSLTSVGDITGGASSMTITAGTGNSRRLSLQTTTSAGAATEAIHFNEQQQTIFPVGAAATPSFAFAGDTTTGLYRKTGFQIGVATNGTERWFFDGSGNLSGGTAGQQLLPTSGGSGASFPAFSFSDDPNTGVYRFGADTLGIATGGVLTARFMGGASARLIGPSAGSLTIQGGTGNNRTVTLSPTSGTGVATDCLSLSVSVLSLGTGCSNFQALNANGAVGTPAYSFTNSATTGMYRFGADTLGFAAGGSAAFRMSSGALQGPDGTFTNVAYGFTGSVGMGMYRNGTSLFLSNGGFQQVQVRTDSIVFNAPLAPGYGIGFQTAATITGGPGNMTVQAGTGASRTMTLQGTDAGSVARNGLTVADSQALGVTGRVGKPSFSFAGATNYGMYKAGSSLALSANGTLIFNGSSSQITMTGTASVLIPNGSAATPGLAGGASGNTGLFMSNGGTDTVRTTHSGVASVGFTGGASATIFGGAGNMTIQPGTGNSRTLALQSTTSAGTAKNTIVLGADTSATFLGQLLGNSSGSSALPVYSFTGSASTGMFWAGQDTVGFATGGSVAVRICCAGASATKIMSASSVFTIANVRPSVAGSIVLSSSNSSGTPTTFLTGSGDTVKFGGHAIATGFTAAAGTPGSICYNTATSELTKNAATSCVVSSIRFKDNVEPLALDSARAIVERLTPVTYTLKDGGRPSLHVIAEQADSISRRLSFRDASDRVNSVDDGAILSALLRVVQDQQRAIQSQRLSLDSLRVELAKVKKP